jgi:hypothetical protein
MQLSMKLHDFSFPGERYARSTSDKDIVIIVDIKGFVAGIQSVVDKSKTNDTIYPFSSSPFYVADEFFGDEVYYATAYFVDPNIICNQVGFGMPTKNGYLIQM